MARNRKEGREHWPRGLYVNTNGFFWCKDPITGKTKGIGRNEDEAIAFVNKMIGAAPLPKVTLVRKTDRDLLQKDQIITGAIPYINLVGIYFLIFVGEIVYIGQSTNVYKRVYEHSRDPEKIFDSFHFVTCDRSELDHLEKKYIEMYAPMFNVRHLPFQTNF